MVTCYDPCSQRKLHQSMQLSSDYQPKQVHRRSKRQRNPIRDRLSLLCADRMEVDNNDEDGDWSEEEEAFANHQYMEHDPNGRSASYKGDPIPSTSSGMTPRRGSKEKNNPLISPTEKCKVCNEPAAKHIHYGSVTCFSCRAFFRRSIQNKSAKVYTCKKQDRCKVDGLKSRKTCQKCRFDRCIEAGMKPSWVLSEEEKHRRFRKTREKKTQLLQERQKQQQGHSDTRSIDCESEVAASPIPANDCYPGASDHEVGIKVEPTVTNLNAPCSSMSSKNQPGLPHPTPSRVYGTPPVTQPSSSSTSSFLIPPPTFGRTDISRPMHNFVEHQPRYRRPLWPSVPPPPPGSYIHSLPAQNSAWPSSSFSSPHPSASHPYSHIKQERDVEAHPAAQAEEERVQQEENEACDSDSDDGSSSNSSSKQQFLQEPIIKMTDEENYQIQKLCNQHDFHYKSVPFGEELIKEMVMCSVLGVPLSTSAAMTGYRLMIQRVTKVAQAFEPFLDLPFSNQSSLLKQNADLLVSLRAAVFFEDKKKGLDQILYSMGVDDIDIGKKLITTAMKNVGYMNRIDYKNFNSLQQINTLDEKESRYDRLLARVGSTIAHRPEFVKILSYVILFSSDFAKLEKDRPNVESIQHMFINMLKRLIYSEHNEKVSVTIFSNTLSVISDLHELTHIKKQRALAPVKSSSDLD